MAIKKTTPRKKAIPMIYFKGSAEGIKKLRPSELRRRLIRIGAEFFNPIHAKEETLRVVRNLRELIAQLTQGKAALTDIRLKQGQIPVRVLKTKSGKILIHQMPQTHGISAQNGTSFRDLISILTSNFLGETAPNSILETTRKRKTTWELLDTDHTSLTYGDEYTIEVNAPIRHLTEENLKYAPKKEVYPPKGTYYIPHATPNQIVTINIKLDDDQKQLMAKKMKFYKEQVQKRFNIPVKFIRG